jgi:hypothetical protein
MLRIGQRAFERSVVLNVIVGIVHSLRKDCLSTTVPNRLYNTSMV